MHLHDKAHWHDNLTWCALSCPEGDWHDNPLALRVTGASHPQGKRARTSASKHTQTHPYSQTHMHWRWIQKCSSVVSCPQKRSQPRTNVQVGPMHTQQLYSARERRKYFLSTRLPAYARNVDRACVRAYCMRGSLFLGPKTASGPHNRCSATYMKHNYSGSECERIAVSDLWTSCAMSHAASRRFAGLLICPVQPVRSDSAAPKF